MLQSIRDRAHGWIAWVIVVLIAIPFALWGIQEYFGVDPNIPVAKVNGDEIPLQEFQAAYQQQQANLRASLGSSFDPDLFEESQLRLRAVETLIEGQLLLQTGAADGLRVSDEQLVSAIHSQPSFIENGRFSQAAYENYLARSGYSPGRFEESLRQDLLTNQLVAGYARSAIATESELRRWQRLERQQRVFEEAVVPVDRFRGAEVAEAAVAAHFDANRAGYVNEEQVVLDYVVLSRDALATGVTIDEGVLRSVYENQRGAFSVPEQRRTSHILIAIDDRRSEDAALAEAKALKARLDEGASFADLASEHSDDPGSAAQAGDLGFLARGVMDPGFEEAAFGLERGVVSGPVRSAFGFHLILVSDVRPGSTLSFEEARPQVLAEYGRQQAEQLYYEQAERLSNLTFEHPSSLEVAAETLNLEIRTSPPLGRAGLPDHPDLGDRRVAAAAFSEDVRGEGNNSEPLEVEGGRIVVVRVNQYRPSTPRTLDEVREEIVAELQGRAARERARGLGERMLERLRAGEAHESVAGSESLRWSEQRTASRRSDALPADVARQLFRMPRPGSPTGASYDGVVDGEGNFRILRLVAVQEDGPEPSPEQLAAGRQALAQMIGRAAYEAFVADLRARAAVTIFQERLSSDAL